LEHKKITLLYSNDIILAGCDFRLKIF